MNTWVVIAVLLGLAVVGISCTLVAFNHAPVTIIDRDSHNAKGTNVKTFDTTISPR